MKSYLVYEIATGIVRQHITTNVGVDDIPMGEGEAAIEVGAGEDGSTRLVVDGVVCPRQEIPHQISAMSADVGDELVIDGLPDDSLISVEGYIPRSGSAATFVLRVPGEILVSLSHPAHLPKTLSVTVQ